MKRRCYAVCYAGRPETGRYVTAASWREAATLFFSNAPRHATIVVSWMVLFERWVRPTELGMLRPDADLWISDHGTDSDLLDPAVRRAHGFESVESVQSVMLSHNKRGLIHCGIGTAALLVGYLLYRLLS